MPRVFDLFAATIFVAIVARFLTRKGQKGQLPPGPKGLPILGNLFQIPSNYPWLTYTEWARKLDSDVVHVGFPGTNIVILNSVDAANELCEKRSYKYSDRPFLTMMCELVDLLSWSPVLLPYGQKWRDARKMFHQYFNAHAVLDYRPKEVRAARNLARRLLGDPEDFLEHIRAATGEIVLDLAYGINVQGTDDPFIQLAEAANQGAVATGTPGAFLVDVIPLLKYVPAWVPGASFQRKAAHWKQLNYDMYNKPYYLVKEQIAENRAPESILRSVLASHDNNPDEYSEWVIKCVTGVMYAAGSDTTVSVLRSFFLAMVLYPEAQRAAQAQLDTVLKGERLPEFADMDSLPYITALVKELERWHPATPLGMPHRSTEDDVYGNYFIPAGSLILTNIWAMTRDPRLYPGNPDAFDPRRFLAGSGGLDPFVRDPSFTFGFGRRSCPGRYMAHESMWMMLATVLTVFDIQADGPKPKEEYISGLVTQALPYKCKITPRSDAATKLVLAALQHD